MTLLHTASFGGIFGLCLGGSVISLIEIVYFFTIRLMSKIIASHNREKNELTMNKINDQQRRITGKNANAIFTMHLNHMINEWNRQ